jgi:hypothetical protein
MKVSKVLKSIGLSVSAVAKMKQIAAGVLSACLLSIALPACGGSEEPEVEPDPGPGPEPVSPYFISFKYNGDDYEIRGDEACLFSQYGEENYKVTGVDPKTGSAITITIEKQVKKGDEYAIYTSSPYLVSAVRILFRYGGSIAEQSLSVSTVDAIEAIGKLTVSEKTDGIFSGAFSCRMMAGEITDGKFTVKETPYE